MSESFFLFSAFSDPLVDVDYLKLDGVKIAGMFWTAFIVWGVGRLGMLFSFRELSRLERAGLRIACGLAGIIVWCVALHAIGYPLGLSTPVFSNEKGFPQVSPGAPVFSFGFMQLLLPALAGYAIDIWQWLKQRKTGKRWELFPGLKNESGTAEAAEYIHYFGPAIVILATALYWFYHFHRWAMNYAWLADNDPWDQTWAVHWIVNSGSLYEPLETGLRSINPATGKYDPIQIFHYLDAYPPGMSLCLSVPTLVSGGNIIWTLKFYAALLPPLGLIMSYPLFVRLAESGLAMFSFSQSRLGDLDVYRTERRESPLFQMTPLKIQAHWLAAAGIVILSCVPGYPSRFIWSHSLIFIMFIAAMMPVTRLHLSWRWAFPAVILVAATQLITTTSGFIIGLNVLLLFVAAVITLPGRSDTPFYKRPGFYALPATLAFGAAVWLNTAVLNHSIVKRASFTQPVSKADAPVMLGYNDLLADLDARTNKVKTKKAEIDALEVQINDLQLASGDSTIEQDEQKQIRTELEQAGNEKEKSEAEKGNAETEKNGFEAKKLEFEKQHANSKSALIRLEAQSRIELKSSLEAGGDAHYLMRFDRSYARNLVRYYTLSFAIADNKADGDLKEEVIRKFHERSPEELSRYMQGYFQQEVLERQEKALQILKEILADGVKRQALMDGYLLEKIEKMRRRAAELERKIKAETPNSDKQKELGKELDEIQAELNKLASGKNLETEVVPALTKSSTMLAHYLESYSYGVMNILELDIIDKVLDGLTEATAMEKIKIVDAALKDLYAAINSKMEHAYKLIESSGYDDPELAPLLIHQCKLMLKEQKTTMDANHQNVIPMTQEQVDELNKSVENLNNEEHSLKIRIFILLGCLAVSVFTALGLHILLFGVMASTAALRLLTVGAGGLALSMAWWGPMFVKYYNAPPGVVRIKDPSKSVRPNMHGSATKKLIETLAHPADIQLDRYWELPPWKWGGTQDRNYSLWEFVHPPPKVGIQEMKLHNSVTSGIGIGIGIAAGSLVFLIAALLYLLYPFWRVKSPEFVTQSNEQSVSANVVPGNTKGSGEGGAVWKSVASETSPETPDSMAAIAGVLPARPADPASLQPDEAVYLFQRNFNYALIFGLALMCAHALIGLFGNEDWVPFQLFAFRYWHVVSIVGTICTVVALAWIWALMREMKGRGLFLAVGFWMLCVVIMGATYLPYRQVALKEHEDYIRQVQSQIHNFQGQKKYTADPNYTATLDKAIGELRGIINDKRLIIDDIRWGWLKLAVIYPSVFWLIAAAISVLIFLVFGNREGHGEEGLFGRFGTPIQSAVFVAVLMMGYTIIQGGSIRRELNDYNWNTTGVMDDGVGAESRMLEHIIKNKAAMGMKTGDRVFPLGGPFRFRFMVAANLGVSYFDYENYDWIIQNILEPERDAYGLDTGLRRIDTFYDTHPVQKAGNEGAMLTANWPVMPDVSNDPLFKGTKFYSYQYADKTAIQNNFRPFAHPHYVRLDMPVRKMPWIDFDSLRYQNGKYVFKNVERPDNRNFPKVLHDWLVKNSYDYVWFDHVFFNFTNYIPQRSYFNLETQQNQNICLFEMILNDCLQSGYFELAPGQDSIAGYRYDKPDVRKIPKYPNMPCYMLKVRKERSNDVPQYWLPAPDTIKYNMNN